MGERESLATLLFDYAVKIEPHDRKLSGRFLRLSGRVEVRDFGEPGGSRFADECRRLREAGPCIRRGDQLDWVSDRLDEMVRYVGSLPKRDGRVAA